MIKILCASTGDNLKLSQKTQELLAGENINNELIIIEDYSLPLYSSRIEESDGIPDKALELTKSIKEAKALIVVAPEYNGSIPPMLNNALAWISRSEPDWRAAFNGKFALLMTHSGGGGQKVLSAMKQQLEHLGCNTLARTFVQNSTKDVNVKPLTQAILKLNKLMDI